MEEKPNWPMRWDLLSRYRLIEIIALWEGRLTTKHLCNSFGIGRQQASKDINTYLAEIAPGNLIYDRHLKGYRPADKFKPLLTSGLADEYLHVMSRSEDLTQTFHGLDLGFTHSEILTVQARAIDPKVLRPILRAIREKRRVETEYVSLSSPQAEIRVISPHTLVCTPTRWHVRAYCEKNKDYRDFVLSRFRTESDIMNESENLIADDRLWNKIVTVVIKPDSRLSGDQQKIIAKDYGMTRKALRLKTRAALIGYLLKAYSIDLEKVEAKAEAQQIIVENDKELRPFLIGAG